MTGSGLKGNGEEQTFQPGAQNFHSLLRLLAEAHDREVSALRSKVTELDRNADHGRGSYSQNFADATVQTDGVPLISPPGAPESDPPRGAELDQGKSEGDFLRQSYHAVRSLTARSMSERSFPKHVVAQALRVLQWRGFDACVGFVICTNAVCIGVELEVSNPERPNGVLRILEMLFLVLYTLELALRLVAHGPTVFHDNWVKFDAVLLFVALGSELLRLVAVGPEDLDKFLVVRLLRLLRILRAARMMGKIKPLKRLVAGFLGSMETLSSTLFALSLAVYVFTCLSMELIARSDKLKAHSEANEVIQEYYGGFAETMMTTFQFVTMDSASAIYRPLIEAQPLLALFFPLIFAILPILLMNLVTAIIVDDAISSSQMDEKAKRLEMKHKCKTLEPEIRRAFQILDVDKTGKLSMEEVVTADFRGIGGSGNVSQLLTPQLLIELYDFLDADGDGSVSEDELVNGVIQLALSESSLEITEVKHLVKANGRYVRSLKQDVERILEQVGSTPRSASRSRTPLTPG